MEVTNWNVLFGLLQLVLMALGTVLWRQFSDGQKRGEKTAAELAATIRDLADYKLHVAEHYVTTSEMSKALTDLNETLKTLFSRLDSIRDLLDKKADK